MAAMVDSSLVSALRWLMTSKTASAPPAMISATKVVTMTMAINFPRMDRDRSDRARGGRKVGFTATVFSSGVELRRRARLSHQLAQAEQLRAEHQLAAFHRRRVDLE